MTRDPLAALVRNRLWRQERLDRADQWPAELVWAVKQVAEVLQPSFLVTSADRSLIYNERVADAAEADCGKYIGEVWPRFFAHYESSIARALAGDAVLIEGAMMPEVFASPVDLSLCPVRNGADAVVAVVATINRARNSGHGPPGSVGPHVEHRIRNTIATIRSIVRRTSDEGDIDDYRAHLEGRIDAIASVQSAFLRAPGEGVELLSLLAEEVRRAGGRESVNATLSGPQFTVNAKAAETLGLAFHELAVNALKYGAWSIRNGHANIYWSTDDREFQFHWMETGLTDLLQPEHRGFGTELLLSSLPYEFGAKCQLTFGPTGISYEMAIPVDMIIQR